MTQSKLIMIPKLAKKYDAKTINVSYTTKYDDADPTQIQTETQTPYYTIPICLDILIKNRVWLAYNSETDTIERPQNLIGVNNHWLNTMLDDHKYKRIDISEYVLR